MLSTLPVPNTANSMGNSGCSFHGRLAVNYAVSPFASFPVTCSRSVITSVGAASAENCWAEIHVFDRIFLVSPLGGEDSPALSHPNQHSIIRNRKICIVRVLKMNGKKYFFCHSVGKFAKTLAHQWISSIRKNNEKIKGCRYMTGVVW